MTALSFLATAHESLEVAAANRLNSKKGGSGLADTAPALFMLSEFPRNWVCRKPSFREDALSAARE